MTAPPPISAKAGQTAVRRKPGATSFGGGSKVTLPERARLAVLSRPRPIACTAANTTPAITKRDPSQIKDRVYRRSTRHRARLLLLDRATHRTYRSPGHFVA